VLQEDASSGIDRHSSLGIYNLAEDFCRAGLHVADSQVRGDLKLRFAHIPYYLHTHSVELALKAYLRAHTIEETDLRRKFRHGLSAILQECAELKLNVRKPKRTTQLVTWLDELTRGQQFRYFEGGAVKWPALHEVREANERILAAVRGKCTRVYFS
jgi:hypothetical protein